MYRRNLNKGYDVRGHMTDERDDADYDMSNEEYELYRYNIPPRYDGNRFRRNNRRGECCRDRAIEVVTDPEDLDGLKGEDEPDEECKDMTSVDDVASKCDKPDHKDDKDAKLSEGSFEKLLQKFGSEELLIISLILTIAGGEDSGEMLLILVLLLLNG